MSKINITVKMKSGGIFSSNAKFPQEEIASGYRFQESLRVVKFINGIGEKITIPWESIDIITEREK